MCRENIDLDMKLEILKAGINSYLVFIIDHIGEDVVWVKYAMVVACLQKVHLNKFIGGLKKSEVKI